MASEIDHIKLANSNQKLIEHLIVQNLFHDWLATVAFYKAVHVVEAVFANNLHCHSHSHADREMKLTRTARFKAVFKNYKHLQNESRNFRYLIFPNTRLTIDDVKSKLIYKRLYGVEQHSLQFLSQQAVQLLDKVQPPPNPNPTPGVE
ncbi:MAG: hypothetical protein ACWGMZ_10815 [Thermoguttaceae bacterium]